MARAPKVLVAGGGFAGLSAALGLKRGLGERVQVTLLSDRPTFRFYPMTTYALFGASGQPLSLPLAEMLAGQGIEWIQTAVQGVDLAGRTLVTRGGPLAFDRLILALGSGGNAVPPLHDDPRAFDIKAARGLRELGHFLTATLERGGSSDPTRLTLVVQPQGGCSLPLYKLALLLSNWRADQRCNHLEIELVSHEESPLGLLGSHASRSLRRDLEAAGVRWISGFRLRAFEPDVLVDRIGKIHRPGQVVTIGTSGHPGNSLPGLPLDRHGLVNTVIESGKVQGQDGVYSVGDLAGLSANRSAFVAIHQGVVAARQVAREVDPTLPELRFVPCAVCSFPANGETFFVRTRSRVGDDEEEMLEADRISVRLRELLTWLWPTWNLSVWSPPSAPPGWEDLIPAFAEFETLLPRDR